MARAARSNLIQIAVLFLDSRRQVLRRRPDVAPARVAATPPAMGSIRPDRGIALFVEGRADPRSSRIVTDRNIAANPAENCRRARWPRPAPRRFASASAASASPRKAAEEERPISAKRAAESPPNSVLPEWRDRCAGRPEVVRVHRRHHRGGTQRPCLERIRAGTVTTLMRADALPPNSAGYIDFESSNSSIESTDGLMTRLLNNSS